MFVDLIQRSGMPCAVNLIPDRREIKKADAKQPGILLPESSDRLCRFLILVSLRYESQFRCHSAFKGEDHGSLQKRELCEKIYQQW